jgi:hypothetical protein
MTLHVPRLPFALDPLIAEAKRRAKQRRVLVLAALVVVGIVVGLAFALRSTGGPKRGGASAHQGVQSSASLGDIVVPANATERLWRAWIRSQVPGSAVSRSVALRTRRAVRSRVAASGATVVRLRVWRTTSPPSIELVAATAIPAAVYLKHRMLHLVDGINRPPMFIEVVDSHGARIIEDAMQSRQDTLYIRGGLAGCYGVLGPPHKIQPCPAK